MPIGLRAYVQHMPDCELFDMQELAQLTCTCGLDAALQAPPVAQPLHAAVEAFLRKWPGVERRIIDMAIIQFVRTNVQYDGPTIYAEIEAMRAALQAPADQDERRKREPDLPEKPEAR